MSDLKTLAEKMTQLEAEIAKPVDGDLKTRPGRLMRQQDAMRELEAAREEYKKVFDKTVHLVLLSGSLEEQEKLAQACADLGSCSYINGYAAYDHLVNRVVEATNGGKIFDSGTYQVVLRELTMLSDSEHKFGLNLGYDRVDVTTRGQMMAIVKNLVEAANGLDFLAHTISRGVRSKALDTKNKDKVNVVVVTNIPKEDQDKLAQKLFKGSYVKYDITEPQENYKEVAIKLFTEIKKKIKGK